MSRNVYSKILRQHIPQSQPLDDRQIINNAGGYVYQADIWKQIERFLILGATGGTYYVNERSLVVEELGVVEKAMAEDPMRLAEMVADVSVNGRAVREAPAQFVLAMMAGAGGDAAAAAYSVVNHVLRTGRQFLDWQNTAKERGAKWNARRRRVTENWYTERTPEQLAYQVAKYRPVRGMTHRDVLRLSHPHFESASHRNLALYMLGKEHQRDALPKVLRDFLAVRELGTSEEVAEFVRGTGITWEFVPDSALNSAEVWAALLPNLPMTALIRNLGKMSALGILDDQGAVQVVLNKLSHVGEAHVHPLWILMALRAYESGKSSAQRANALSWTPNATVERALERAFHASFAQVAPSDKRYLIAVDVSSSMSYNMAGNNISCAQAAGALSLVFRRMSPSASILGFTTDLIDLGIRGDESIGEATAKVQKRNFGGTDCALPMIWAAKKGESYDAFVVLTDSETWAGGIHPMDALRVYRDRLVPNAKMAVVGMAANAFTIADPADPFCMDVVGFDPTIPKAIEALVNM